MAEYGKVYKKIWRDQDFRALSENARFLFLYILTTPHLNAIGFFVLHEAYVTVDMHWPMRKVKSTLQELADNRFILYDRKSGSLIIRSWFHHNKINNDRHLKKAQSELTEMFQSTLLSDFQAIVASGEDGRYKQIFDGLSPEFIKLREIRIRSRRQHFESKVGKKVLERDGGKCVRCGSRENLTLDHILPASMGGLCIEANLRVLCRSCNSKRPIGGQALIDDLRMDGFTLEGLVAECLPTGAMGIDTHTPSLRPIEEEETEEEAKEEEATIPFESIISHLNILAQKKRGFDWTTDYNQKQIRRRWKEGRKLEDFLYVNLVKSEEWLATDMEKHLNPETLYGNKMEKYLNQRRIPRQYSEKINRALLAAAEYLKEGGFEIEESRQAQIDSVTT